MIKKIFNIMFISAILGISIDDGLWGHCATGWKEKYVAPIHNYHTALIHLLITDDK